MLHVNCLILGRPNVGKSTLFNRLVGGKPAIVHDEPGVTRDVQWAEAQLAKDITASVADSAGLEELFDESLEARMRRQTEAALAKADVVIFVVDAKQGLTTMDEQFAKWLRKQDIPVVLIANKAEGRDGFASAQEAARLGFGAPVTVSAEHGQGIAELVEAVKKHAKTQVEIEEAEKEHPLKMAIVGRPNVGKSTLINSLVGEDRLLTGPEAGITRDAITIDWEYKGKKVELIDTAGVRRRSKVSGDIEKLSVADTLTAIQFAEVVVLMLDAELGIDKQDLQIASHVVNEGRALVIAFNKWDCVKDPQETYKTLRETLDYSLAQIQGVRVVKMSGLKGEGIDALMKAVETAYKGWNKRIPTAKLNEWLMMKLQQHAPPLAKGRRLKIRYITQSKSRPPRFVLFCNLKEEFPTAYLRYLINGLRDDFGLAGVPIRLLLRQGANPYDKKKD